MQVVCRLESTVGVASAPRPVNHKQALSSGGLSGCTSTVYPVTALVIVFHGVFPVSVFPFVIDSAATAQRLRVAVQRSSPSPGSRGSVAEARILWTSVGSAPGDACCCRRKRPLWQPLLSCRPAPLSRRQHCKRRDQIGRAHV